MKYSKNSFIYYIAFILLATLRLCISSNIINFPLAFNYSIIILVAVLFILKILLDNHNLTEYLILLVLIIFFIYIYMITKNLDFMISLLAIVAIKNINIRMIVKLDIAIKLIFLFTHGSIYLINYLLNYDAISNLIIFSSKGASHALYFSNPNTVGAIVLLLVLDFLFLKKNINKKHLVWGFLALIVSYLICRSRTPFFIYIIFIGLQFIKNIKITNFLGKYSYLFLGLITFIIINYLDSTNHILLLINKFFSNRIVYSIAAYQHYGLAILPSSAANNFLENFIIDNFYTRCFINYSVIVFLLIGIIGLKIPKKGFKLEKDIFIIIYIYLFFEAVAINIGFALPLLIMGDIVLYRKNYKEVIE